MKVLEAHNLAWLLEHVWLLVVVELEVHQASWNTSTDTSLGGSGTTSRTSTTVLSSLSVDEVTLDDWSTERVSRVDDGWRLHVLTAR